MMNFLKRLIFGDPRPVRIKSAESTKDLGYPTKFASWMGKIYKSKDVL